jgi:hypothetical protein
MVEAAGYKYTEDMLALAVEGSISGAAVEAEDVSVQQLPVIGAVVEVERWARPVCEARILVAEAG